MGARSLVEVHAAAARDPETFWAEAASAIAWSKPWRRVLETSSAPFYRWFDGAELNTCYNAVDRHVAGRGAQTALIYDSPVTGTVATYTFAELQSEVARLAGALHALGVSRGDTVVIYMPMIPEAVFAMLACAANPPNTPECTAPSRAHASLANTASGIIGR